VLLKGDEVVREWSGHVPDEHTQGTRQVAGELFAVGIALKWCQANGIDEVHVYFDYQGIESWATGKWKAKQDLTQRYQAFVRSCGIRLHWHKVAAHTGVKWNERADYLAKAGTGKPLQPAPAAPHSPTPKRNTPPAAPAADAEKRQRQVEEVLAGFARHLERAALPSRYIGFLNGMFGRLEISSASGVGTLGYFDLYHTPKKPMTPRTHGFPTADAERLIISHWEQYRAARP
jgi:ribonuclease HI